MEEMRNNICTSLDDVPVAQIQWYTYLLLFLLLYS
jgi:hypothetical protein